jgi:hypothetical protein
MYHTIEFSVERYLDIEISSKHHLERVLIRPGQRLRAQLKPGVVETAYGPIEVADLFLDDGTAARGVPYACFSFSE